MKKIELLLILLLFAVNLLAIDTVAVKTIGNGIVYYHLKTEEPNNIYILKADLKDNNNVNLTIANERIGNKGATVNEMSRELTKKAFVFAGVNADFFGGSPYQFENSMIINGEFAKGVNIGRSLFAITSEKKLYIDTIKFSGYLEIGDKKIKINTLNHSEGDVKLFNRFYNLETKIRDKEVAVLLKPAESLKLNKPTKFIIKSVFDKQTPKFLFSDRCLAILPKEVIEKEPLKLNDTIKVFLGTNPSIENVKQMIGGLPKILVQGETIKEFAGREGIDNKGFFSKNPRTAIGFDQEQQTLYIVAVDGRDSKNSVGLTLPELSLYMKGLGCYEALNFDGGGSTTMVLRDSTVNKPTDFTGERAVNNALFLCSDVINPELFSSIKVYCDKNTLRLNENVELKIEVIDILGFKSNLNSELLNFEYDKEFCIIAENKIKVIKEGAILIKWSFGKFNGELNLTIE